MTTQWTIKVWWRDGRVTEHTADSRGKALDVVSGECHPFERYELTSGPVTVEAQAKLLIHTKTFRAHLWQRFRYTPSGRQYVLTQTKRGTMTVWVSATPKVLGPSAVAEQWRKADAVEAADAINDIAAWHSKAPEFLQFFTGEK